MVSIHAERTFERLRYSLGGDRPSQTAHLTMSPDLLQSRRLEFQHSKSGIPRSTPHKLTPVLPSLPPILYVKYRNPILGYSKANPAVREVYLTHLRQVTKKLFCDLTTENRPGILYGIGVGPHSFFSVIDLGLAGSWSLYAHITGFSIT